VSRTICFLRIRDSVAKPKAAVLVCSTYRCCMHPIAFALLIPLYSYSLCFVHGLNPWSSPNHAFETWTHGNGKFWPADFLPTDIPEARIFLYGYNSNVAKDVSEASIKDHANVLLDRLQRRRKTGRRHGTIPLVFIGHSLGGLVIKQALLNAQDNSTFEPIKNSTYGMVFFGTPHKGGRNAALGNLAAKVARFVSGKYPVALQVFPCL
jgi:hypothetical protein